MMNVEDFRIMFRAHLSHELWDKWRNGQLDVSMRRNTPDGCEYEELPKEAADRPFRRSLLQVGRATFADAHRILGRIEDVESRADREGRWHQHHAQHGRTRTSPRILTQLGA